VLPLRVFWWYKKKKKKIFLKIKEPENPEGGTGRKANLGGKAINPSPSPKRVRKSLTSGKKEKLPYDS